MRRLHSIIALLVAAGAFPPAQSTETHAGPVQGTLPAAETTPADAAFRRLSGLEGEWADAGNPASPLRIRFYLTAGSTTLVEEWTAAGKPHSLTLYHRDGDTLVATHYCPQGNQPRLALARDASNDAIAFAFRDATDLGDGESALHDLGFDLSDPARPVRSETYRRGQQGKASSLTLVRAGGTT